MEWNSKNFGIVESEQFWQLNSTLNCFALRPDGVRLEDPKIADLKFNFLATLCGVALGVSGWKKQEEEEWNELVRALLWFIVVACCSVDWIVFYTHIGLR